MNYKLELCNDLTNWSNFIKKSKQFNVFASSQFLKNKFKEYEAYFFYKDNIILIGCLFKKDLNSKNNEMYQNIFYSNFFDKINISKSLKLKIESTDELLKQLYMKFKNIKLCLHHSIKDIRAFQWFNYHEKNNKFHINIKYTALLDLKPYIDFSEYFNQIRASRRQDYNKSIKNQFITSEEMNSDTIAHLLEKTFQRQNITSTKDEIAHKKAIITDSIRNNYGRLLVSYSPKKKPVSASCFLFDNNFAYYFAGATNPAYRNFGIGTQVIIDQMQYFYSKNIKKFDFIGINSPNRGDFKTSFNSKPTIYFEMNLIK